MVVVGGGNEEKGTKFLVSFCFLCTDFQWLCNCNKESAEEGLAAEQERQCN